MADYWQDLLILYKRLTQPTGSSGFLKSLLKSISESGNIFEIGDFNSNFKLIFFRDPQINSLQYVWASMCHVKEATLCRQKKRPYCTIGISFCWSARCVFCLCVFCLKGGWSVSNDARHDTGASRQCLNQQAHCSPKPSTRLCWSQVQPHI